VFNNEKGGILLSSPEDVKHSKDAGKMKGFPASFFFKPASSPANTASRISQTSRFNLELKL
jgi:hypothetical protein